MLRLVAPSDWVMNGLVGTHSNHLKLWHTPEIHGGKVRRLVTRLDRRDTPDLATASPLRDDLPSPGSRDVIRSVYDGEASVAEAAGVERRDVEEAVAFEDVGRLCRSVDLVVLGRSDAEDLPGSSKVVIGQVLNVNAL